MIIATTLFMYQVDHNILSFSHPSPDDNILLELCYNLWTWFYKYVSLCSLFSSYYSGTFIFFIQCSLILERKILRKIYGPTKENGQWRIKTNEELMTKYKAPDIVNVIKIRRLEWLGHVVRMNETRSVKKIFEGKLEGRRGRGRPRLGWINDVEDDLRKLGVKRWRTKALEREEWASIVKEAKAKLKGPYCYRKKKFFDISL